MALFFFFYELNFLPCSHLLFFSPFMPNSLSGHLSVCFETALDGSIPGCGLASTVIILGYFLVVGVGSLGSGHARAYFGVF